MGGITNPQTTVPNLIVNKAIAGQDSVISIIGTLPASGAGITLTSNITGNCSISSGEVGANGNFFLFSNAGRGLLTVSGAVNKGATLYSTPTFSGLRQVNAADGTGIVINDDGSVSIPSLSGGVSAWAKVTNNGTVAALTKGLNIASVARAGVGMVNVNFTTALADVNYAVAGMCPNSSSMVGMQFTPTSTTQVLIRTFDVSFTLTDGAFSIIVFD